MRRTALLLGLAILLAPRLGQAEEKGRSYTISPNEHIHVIQRKVDLLGGRLELTAYPATIQINSRWTQHVGFGAAAAYHFMDTFGLQLLGNFNSYLARETDLQAELRDKALLQPPSAPSILTRWYTVLAMEMSPIYGKIAYYKNAMLTFSLFLTGGLGVADTAVQLLLRTPTDGGREYKVAASAGLWPAGVVGGGFRVMLADHWALRLEIRDLVYSARITKLNGCTPDELSQLASAPTNLSEGCRTGAFDPNTISTDAKLAEGRADGSSETVNQVSGYVGVSYFF
ncbi:MAG: outer membrane beta-barrel domain-containing protein [Deltaproteobacteria bacterium]|nr:outer membrane beta-barrel domain-containing protein [Deltaproteobacteria bacterium]